MVSLEKNDHLMLARQLPLKSVALILAGGRGTRLKDLTNKRAKPAVHFGGKFPSTSPTLWCSTFSAAGHSSMKK